MLGQIKEHLGITWDDEDAALEDMIERGKSKLSTLAGVELDYQNNDQARHLLFEWCRYAYNNASEYFEENFQSEILSLQYQTGISEFAVSLSSITIEDAELNPEFEPIITDYTAETSSESSNIEVEPRKADADISITVNGNSVENDTSYSWQPEDNTVEITINKDGNSRTYTVVVTYEE